MLQNIELKSFIPIIISLVALITTYRHNNKILSLENSNKQLTEKYNQLVSGQSEIYIQNLISTSKKNVLDYCSYMNENPSEGNKAQLDIRQQHLWALQEENLNAYETACSLYLDSKIDKERFKKQYSNEIKILVENEEISKKFFSNGLKIKFGAIDKIYKEWFHLEK